MNIHFLKKRINAFPLLMLAASIILIPVWVLAQPALEPTGGNVEANFYSVKLPTGPKMTGSFGKFVGLTGSTNGDMNGYSGARDLCQQAYSDSHVCTANEIINSIEYGIVLPSSGQVWINNGPPAYISDLSNDCMGWKMDNSNPKKMTYFWTTKAAAFGSTWDFSENEAFMSLCEESLAVACCKY